MPSKVAIAKRLAQEKQLARQNERISNLTKKKRKSGGSDASPRKTKSVKKDIVASSPKSNKKRSRSLVNAAIDAAKKKNRTQGVEAKAVPVQLKTSATKIAKSKAKAAAERRRSAVSSPKKRASASPVKRKAAPPPIEIEEDETWAPPTPKFEETSDEEEIRIETPISTVKAIDFEDLTESVEAELIHDTKKIVEEDEREVPRSRSKGAKRSAQVRPITLWQRIRFVLVVGVLSCSIFLAGIVAMDYILGQEAVPAIAGPKLLELPSSAHSVQVSEILETTADSESFEGWNQDSLNRLREMYSSLPKAKQDELLAKSIHDLSVAVYRMQQTNRWLKYGVTFVGYVSFTVYDCCYHHRSSPHRISTVCGWLLGPLLL